MARRSATFNPQFPLLAEVLRFSDEHLMGMDTGIREEAPIHYHTVHGENWNAATQWPPIEKPTRWSLHPSGGLSRDRPSTEARAQYQVRFTTGTGTHTKLSSMLETLRVGVSPLAIMPRASLSRAVFAEALRRYRWSGRFTRRLADPDLSAK